MDTSSSDHLHCPEQDAPNGAKDNILTQSRCHQPGTAVEARIVPPVTEIRKELPKDVTYTRPVRPRSVKVGIRSRLFWCKTEAQWHTCSITAATERGLMGRVAMTLYASEPTATGNSYVLQFKTARPVHSLAATRASGDRTHPRPLPVSRPVPLRDHAGPGGPNP